MKVHTLELNEHAFEKTKAGSRRAVLRKNDSDFRIGDYLILQEYQHDGYKQQPGEKEYQITMVPYGHYTGNAILSTVTDVCTYADALKDGYVMLSFKKLEGQA